MAKRKNYDEVSIINSLLRNKKTVKIDRKAKVISIPSENIELGNGSWGKLDFLKNYCGYVITHYILKTKIND